MAVERKIDGLDDGTLGHVRAVEERVGGLERGLDTLGKRVDRFASDINGKLDALSRAVTMQAAQPQFRVGEVLDVVTKCAALLGMAAAAIIFIATSISSAPLAKIEAQMQHDRETMRALVLEMKQRGTVAAAMGPRG